MTHTKHRPPDPETDGTYASAPLSDRLPSSPTSEGREETSQAASPLPDWAVISAIRHELWQASLGRGYGEERTLVGMVRKVIAERDEARGNRKGEHELRSAAEHEVATLRASLAEAQAEIERLKAALVAAVQFLQPEIHRGPDSDGWLNTCELVSRAIPDEEAIDWLPAYFYGGAQ